MRPVAGELRQRVTMPLLARPISAWAGSLGQSNTGTFSGQALLTRLTPDALNSKSVVWKCLPYVTGRRRRATRCSMASDEYRNGLSEVVNGKTSGLHVIVCGAGVVGASTAYFLTKKGAKVRLACHSTNILLVYSLFVVMVVRHVDNLWDV